MLANSDEYMAMKFCAGTPDLFPARENEASEVGWSVFKTNYRPLRVIYIVKSSGGVSKSMIVPADRTHATVCLCEILSGPKA